MEPVTSELRVTLVGETNPYGSEPRYALYDLPETASGARLRRILGLDRRTYLGLTRMNLCLGHYSTSAARDVADAVKRDLRRGDVVVMLGRKVATAFGVRGPFFTRHDVTNWTDAVATLVSLPHPSGLCRLWNEDGAVARARSLLADVAPHVPWGSDAEE